MTRICHHYQGMHKETFIVGNYSVDDRAHAGCTDGLLGSNVAPPAKGGKCLFMCCLIMMTDSCHDGKRGGFYKDVFGWLEAGEFLLHLASTVFKGLHAHCFV